jgi:hypothetical protein
MTEKAVCPSYPLGGVMQERIGLILVLLFCISVPSPNAQQLKTPTENEETLGRSNGRLWVSMPLSQKLMTIGGIIEGMYLLADHLYQANKGNAFGLINDVLTVRGSLASDHVTERDLFYKQGANIRIPISYAYLFSVKKMKGASAEELEKYAASLRKQFNQ